MKIKLPIVLALCLLAFPALAQNSGPGNEIQVTAAPAVTNGSYSTGNALGALSSYEVAKPNVGTGFIQSFLVNSAGGSTPSLDVFFFNANPTGSTCTDKTAFALAAADVTKLIGVAQITSWIAAGTPTQGQATQLALPFRIGTGRFIWACVVDRTTFTPGSTSDITYSVGVVQD